MLAGFSGRLVSELFLEARVGDAGIDEAPPLRRPLAAWRRQAADLGPASSPRALLERGADPLLHVLGFSPVTDVRPLKNAAAATACAGSDRVALIVACWAEPLDPLWRAGVEHAAAIGATWCVFFNGTHARIIETRRLYSRRHIEFDVDLAIDDVKTCRALEMVMSARRMESTRGVGSPLHVLIADSERHAHAVCRSLRTGVFEASTAIFAALAGRNGRGESATAYEQSLTIVYRILFLLFAEARHLVPLWHPLYRDSYSVETLCDLAGRQPAPAGLRDTIRAVSRLAHAGCRIGDLHVTAFNGRLFSPSRTPLIERAGLDDGAARTALVALSTQAASDGQGRERIAYRDLGVEELGSVYESLLDYQPGGDRTLRAGSGERKSTGTFYTPRGMAEFIVRRTLAPLVRGASADRILALRILDPSMGSGAFLVAACSFLAHAYENAMVTGDGYHPSDFGPRERVAIRRTIAERCLFGVDINPMAVQLARLSLWLATLAADRPLSFLDHHLVCGDSIVGAWLSSLTRAPDRGRPMRDRLTLPLFDVEALGDTMRAAVPVRFDLATSPNDTPEQVRDKERSLAALSRSGGPLAAWKRLADLWCAHWFSPEARVPGAAFGALSDWLLRGERTLSAATAKQYTDAAAAAAAAARFFHWELEFPEAFFDRDGRRCAGAGFDAVVGNPPWDMMRGDSGSPERRETARGAAASIVRFTRESGVYSHQSDGHANRYQLFVERCIRLTRPGGRIGLVVPSGLATDHGSARLRRLLFGHCAVDGIVGFENTARIFPIHRSVRFQLITATSGRPTCEFGCRLGERDASVLDSAPEGRDARWFPVRITPELLERVTGADVALPDFRSAMDVRLADRCAALFPALGDPAGWHARFGRELNATDDRDHLHKRRTGSVPIVEGKMLAPFRVSKEGRLGIRASDAARLLGDRCLRRRLAYRDVASATNRVTLIAAVLPARTASTHTVFCLRTPLAIRAQHFLCGMFNSFVVNYLVRLRVTTHVTTGIVARLPIPLEHDCPGAFREIAAIARLLARRDRPALFARLNARVAELYQLTPEEFAHVLDTFPLVERRDREATLAVFESYA